MAGGIAKHSHSTSKWAGQCKVLDPCTTILLNHWPGSTPEDHNLGFETEADIDNANSSKFSGYIKHVFLFWVLNTWGLVDMRDCIS